MVEEGLILHWDNAPVHTTRIVTDFLATKEMVVVLSHPTPLQSRSDPCEFFLFTQDEEQARG